MSYYSIASSIMEEQEIGNFPEALFSKLGDLGYEQETLQERLSAYGVDESIRNYFDIIENISSGGAATPPLPAENILVHYDALNAASLTTTGSLVDQWDDLSGNDFHATSSGSDRPTLFADATADGGPKERLRFADSQGMTIPSGLNLSSREFTAYVVFRCGARQLLDSGSALNFLETTLSNLGMFTSTGGLCRVNDGAAHDTTFYLQGGVHVLWLRGSASAAHFGVGNQQWSKGSAFTNRTVASGRIGQWSTGGFRLDGDIQKVVIYNATHTDEQVGEALDNFSALYGCAGSSGATFIGFDGDSITEGVQNAAPQTNPHSSDFSFPAQFQMLRSAAGSPVSIANFAIGGEEIADNTAPSGTTQVMGAFPGITNRVLFVLYGYNDIAAGTSLATLKSDYESYITYCRSNAPGIVIGAGSLLPTTSFSTDPKASIYSGFNEWIMDSEGSHGLDFSIDLNSIAALQDPSDTSLFVDGVHPTTLGYSHVASAVYSGIAAAGY